MTMINRLLLVATVGFLLAATAVKFTTAYSTVIQAALAANEAAQSTQTKRVIYVPPKRGAPTRRVGGATRGTEEEEILVAVLAPESTGLTSRESPTLYWYVSRVPSRQVEFGLIRDDRIEPVAEVTLAQPSAGGVAAVSLANLGVILEPGVTYEWSIALVKDPLNRSTDIVTSGTLIRVVPNEALGSRLRGADAKDKLTIYGEAGYWYDAIELASEAIVGAVEADTWRSHRASLLEQVGLKEIASYDRSS